MPDFIISFIVTVLLIAGIVGVICLVAAFPALLWIGLCLAAFLFLWFVVDIALSEDEIN